MKLAAKPLFTFAVAALALASCAPQAATQPEMQTATAAAEAPLPAFANVEAVAERFVSEGKVANMVVGVALPDGGEAWVREGTLAFGSDVAADEQSLYRVYSMTKPVTGIAAAILVDEGKLELDQPISDFFPEFADMEVLVDPESLDETRPAARQITVRDLLTHTAGLSYSIGEGPLAKAYAQAGIVPGFRRRTIGPPPGPQPASLDAFARKVAELPLRTDPGTEWHYSISLDLLGAVVEKASGMPFETFLEQRIFDPLGMDDTGFVVPAADVGRLTDNYFLMNGRPVPADPAADSEYLEAAPFPAGGAGLVSTGEDYLRFIEAAANGGRLDGEQALPAGAVRLATSNLLPEGVTFGAFGADAQGFGAGGRVITNPAGGEVLGSYGWGGAASTLASAFPNENIAFVMMTQLLGADDLKIREALAQALAADLAAMQQMAAAE